MLMMRRFTDSDWEGFNGAVPFADDMDPLIGEVEIIAGEIHSYLQEFPQEFVVICDVNGLKMDSDNDCYRAVPGEEINVLFQLTPFMKPDEFDRLIENGLLRKIN
jgi:hypothetical protein